MTLRTTTAGKKSFPEIEGRPWPPPNPPKGHPGLFRGTLFLEKLFLPAVVALVLTMGVGCAGLRGDTANRHPSGYNDGEDDIYNDDLDTEKDQARVGMSTLSEGGARNAGNGSSMGNSFGNMTDDQKRLYRSEVITRGMTTNEVRAMYGQPTEVDYAGQTSAGNQRWTYSNGLSDRWNIRSPRVIYFEGDRVSGWSFPRD